MLKYIHFRIYIIFNIGVCLQACVIMDVKFSIAIVLPWTCIFFLTMPTHVLGKNIIKQRLNVLERKFTTNVIEISTLQQRTENIENRLSALESDTNITSKEVQNTEVSSDVTEEESDNKVLFQAFKAEKIQRLQLQEKCIQMENMINNLNSRIDDISRFQQTLDMPSLQKQAETNTQSIKSIEASLNRTFGSLTSTLNNEVVDTKKYIDNKVSDIQDIISSNTDSLHQKIDKYQTSSVSTADVNRLLQGKKIAFSARLKSSVANLNPEQTLVFTDVLTNDGKAYSSASGLFTAPIEGTYVFFVHILGADRGLEMRMNKNKERVMYLYVNGRAHGADSNMVILRMVKGDTVNVVKNGPYGSRPFYVHVLWTTFSGFLLYAN